MEPGHLASKRLRRELAAFHTNSPGPHIRVCCDEWNMLSMCYLLAGRHGTPYEGGWYWGKLRFPENYPLAPPSVTMLTPSGRFQTGTRICLSVSDFHPESWKPCLGFATVLEGLRNFMSEDHPTVGSIDPLPTADERRRLAGESSAWNMEHPEFRAAFPDADASSVARAGDGAKTVEVRRTDGEATSQPSTSPENATSSAKLVGKFEADADEDVSPEFECSICMKLLFEPISVSCGHTFCRRCLTQSLDYRSLCAICRAPVTGGQNVNILIKDLIANRYPRTLARRTVELRDARIAAEEGANAERHRMTLDAGPILPLLRLFVGAVPFPHSRAEINVTTSDEAAALDYAVRGGRRLGVLPASGNVGIGCCVAVEDVRRLQPGRGRAVSVQVLGLFRFRLVEEPQLNEDCTFELGRFIAIYDDPLPEEQLVSSVLDNGQVTTLHLAQEAIRLIDQQLTHVGLEGRQAFHAHFGRVPTLAVEAGSPAVTSMSVEHFSFWLAAAAVAKAERRRLWLTTCDTRARIQDCTAVLASAGGRLALNLPGAKSWMNAGRSANGNVLVLIGLVLILSAKAAGLL
eukprot:TRINITY_DN68391_c0_g1_i1.p1 TRINITY_DN68391_c0_g1~~TRINITY_DN68391_c0_g1_i1.p1  ORF type:complete len:592 (+),score=96.60 TRINITY_DN68391_c0_g1_i1:54-1778(+)